MQKNITYHLVLEARPGDFMPIDINTLIDNSKIDFTSLQEIDNFTKKYLFEELIAIIKESNIVPKQYLEGKLQIINNNKYRYPVLYKNITFIIDDFLINNITDKQKMNKFLNIYLKYTNENKEEMQKAINEKDSKKILNLLSKISYVNIRNIYFYLYNNVVN